jgi:hypothetical protein
MTIVHFKYQQNRFKKTTIDGKMEERTFGKVVFSHIDRTNRIPGSDQPFIQFELSLDENEKVTDVTQMGTNLFYNYLFVLSNMGGLYQPLSFLACLFVAYFERPGFIAYITGSIYLISKYQEIDNEEEFCIARGFKHYSSLKENLENSKVTLGDIQEIVRNIFNERYTMNIAQEEPYFYATAYLKPILCCLRKSPQSKFQGDRLDQAQRKFEKMIDFRRTMRSIQNSNILVNSIMTEPQRLLSKFQRQMLVEQVDVTDSSDQLDDYYQKDPEIKVAILESLMKLTKS